jgi:hypothetical protein
MVDTVTLRSPESTGPSLEEEAAAMDAKAAEVKSSGGLPSDGTEPEKILGRFKSQEDLIKAYTELEKKLGSKEPPKDTPKEPEAPPADDDAAAKEAVESAGLNMQALSDEYAEKGVLSDEAYKKLEKVNIPRDVVDEYIAGKQALMKMAESAVYETVGGKDTYSEMTAWAADNLDDAEIDVFNEAVNSGSKAKVLSAVKGLKAQYDVSADVREPSRLVSGKTSKASVYRSTAELMKDMGDKRYHADPAYRQDVQEKLARSNIF